MNDAENLSKLLGHLPPAVFREFMVVEFHAILTPAFHPILTPPVGV